MNGKESGVRPRLPTRSLPRYAVLLVDDDPIALETTAACLEDFHDVVSTTKADEALKLLDRCRFDVVVSDWRMPGLDGVQLLTRVAKREPPIACLLISGAIDELASQVPADQRRLLAILAKPFSAEQLLDRIAQLGRIAAMKDEVRRLRGAR